MPIYFFCKVLVVTSFGIGATSMLMMVCAGTVASSVKNLSDKELGYFLIKRALANRFSSCM